MPGCSRVNCIFIGSHSNKIPIKRPIRRRASRKPTFKFGENSFPNNKRPLPGYITKRAFYLMLNRTGHKRRPRIVFNAYNYTVLKRQPDQVGFFFNNRAVASCAIMSSFSTNRTSGLIPRSRQPRRGSYSRFHTFKNKVYSNNIYIYIDPIIRILFSIFNNMR